MIFGCVPEASSFLSKDSLPSGDVDDQLFTKSYNYKTWSS